MTNEQINKHISKVIREIQNAGLTIAKNADKMVGGYISQTGDIDIHVCIPVSGSGATVITVDHELVPDTVYDESDCVTVLYGRKV